MCPDERLLAGGWSLRSPWSLAFLSPSGASEKRSFLLRCEAERFLFVLCPLLSAEDLLEFWICRVFSRPVLLRNFLHFDVDFFAI
ncbi:hypothetical protein NPIL_439091 [Nephila pilipes]|uniref:Uncharacterized protein n=1 Tax=Nephila pilipes TaxID=299642 RepID=A0A8X6QIH2_NEPPI|nr:hypothetical protein NPIL_439091 [Nephila pilipes]